MKNHRRSRRHFKAKATPGAFNDRNGPRRTTDTVHALGAPDPWIRDWPVFGLPVVKLLPDGAVLPRL